MALSSYICVAFLLFLSFVQAKSFSELDEQACEDLCWSCGGVVSYDNEKCECDVGGSTSKGMDCIGRMKRQANDRGLNFVSCKRENKKTRCTVQAKKFLNRDDAEIVAQYFKGNGPLIGSVFVAPPYENKLKGHKISSSAEETKASARTSNDDNDDEKETPDSEKTSTEEKHEPHKNSKKVVGDSHRLITQPKGTMPQSKYKAPPKKVGPSSVPPSSPCDVVGDKRTIAQPEKTVSKPKPIEKVVGAKVKPTKKPKIVEPKKQPVKEATISEMGDKVENVGAPNLQQQQESTEDFFTEEPITKVKTSTTVVNNCEPKEEPTTVSPPTTTPAVPNNCLQVLGCIDTRFRETVKNIPKALEAVSKSEPINKLANIPVDLLNKLIQRIGKTENDITKQPAPKLTSSLNKPKSSLDDSIVGAENPEMTTTMNSFDLGEDCDATTTTTTTTTTTQVPEVVKSTPKTCDTEVKTQPQPAQQPPKARSQPCPCKQQAYYYPQPPPSPVPIPPSPVPIPPSPPSSLPYAMIQRPMVSGYTPMNGYPALNGNMYLLGPVTGRSMYNNQYPGVAAVNNLPRQQQTCLFKKSTGSYYYPSGAMRMKRSLVSGTEER